MEITFHESWPHAVSALCIAVLAESQVRVRMPRGGGGGQDVGNTIPLLLVVRSRHAGTRSALAGRGAAGPQHASSRFTAVEA